MFAVLFEVQPRPDKWQGYLDVAAVFRPELEQIDGFIENTRYRSLTRKGVLLSLSLWRDEKAVIRWRTQAIHFAGQARGRTEIFAGYRLRVGEVAAMSERGAYQALPAQRLDETEAGDARAVILRLQRDEPNTDGFAAAIATDTFEGVVDPADRLAMASFATMAEADLAVASDSSADRQITVRVIREYGLIDRREAPQFHEPVHPGLPA